MPFSRKISPGKTTAGPVRVRHPEYEDRDGWLFFYLRQFRQNSEGGCPLVPGRKAYPSSPASRNRSISRSRSRGFL